MQRRSLIEWCRDLWAAISPTPRILQKPIKIAIYIERWVDGDEGDIRCPFGGAARLVSTLIMGPTTLDELELIAKYGSIWQNEILTEYTVDGGSGTLIIRVIRG
jgi:hypothetical protein